MNVTKIEDLPKFDPKEMLTVDVETTSFDDKKEAFNPFQGDRIAGVAVCTMDQKHSWYVPIRHSDNPAENIPLENARLWLKDVLESGRDIVNHFIKFDARFWHFEGCTVKGRLIATEIMARLWKSDLRNFSLNYLTGGEKDKAVKTYLKQIKSKDYGRVPLAIIGPYAEQDVILAAGLYKKYKSEMRGEVKGVWKTEIGLTKQLVKTEIHGFNVDVNGLRTTYSNLLRRMLRLQEEIDKIAGCEVDCLSSPQLTEVLCHRMGFEPQSYTPKGSIQWNRSALAQIAHPIGDKISEYTHLSYFTTTFCEGWLKRLGDDNRLHTNFRQESAKTGRMASKDPCVTNLSMEAEMFIIPDEGCAILGADYSQIEYRIFAHYANNREIINQYNQNAKTDYHQTLADMLGVPRNFAKSLNFAFLYGMGKKTLLQTIAGVIAMSQDAENMAEKLRTYGLIAGHVFAKKVKDMDFSDFKVIANGIYNQYHKKVPDMKALDKRVYNAISARGWLRNYMGRVYTVPPKAAYKGVNLLIQGTAADIFKDRLLDVLEQMPEMQMITNVYDSIYFNVPLELMGDCYEKMIRIMEDFDLRVPLVATPTVSKKSLGTCVKIDSASEIPAALEKSLTVQKEFRRKTMHINDFAGAGKRATS
jgi:DNA polymerase-1|tara:strand:- start:1455 stop:3383 length:1929 start_codon:yes stop_codon:yes gene_type:complete